MSTEEMKQDSCQFIVSLSLEDSKLVQDLAVQHGKTCDEEVTEMTLHTLAFIKLAMAHKKKKSN